MPILTEMEIWVAVIAGLPGLAGLWIALRKTRHENARTDAEANRIHAQVADRWAKHVEDLMERVKVLESQHEKDLEEIRGLRMDIAQVRRENEEYRRENTDLKSWAERLVRQVREHAPHVMPAEFIRQARETL